MRNVLSGNLAPNFAPDF